MNFITPDLYREGLTSEDVEVIIRDLAELELKAQIRKLDARAERNPVHREHLQRDIDAFAMRLHSETEIQVRKVLNKRLRLRVGPEYCAECIYRDGIRCGIAHEVITASIKETCDYAGWRKRRVSNRQWGKSHTSSSGRRRESGAKEK